MGVTILALLLSVDPSNEFVDPCANCIAERREGACHCNGHERSRDGVLG